MENISSWHI